MRYFLSFPLFRWLFLPFFLAISLSCAAAQPETAPAPVIFQSALFLQTDDAYPPQVGDWQNVALPDVWNIARYSGGNNGWYRFTLTLDEIPQQNWGIYLRRLNMNAAIYLNDFYLGDGGRFSEPIARNWNRPLYFVISPGHWKKGVNTIYIRLKSYPGYGRLDPVTVGPETEVRADYNFQVLVQNDINGVLVLSTLFAAIFIFGIWLRRRADQMYLWYALMALIWTLFTSNTVIRDIPFQVKAWDWITYSCTAWWTVSLAIFSHRAAGIQRPHLEYVFLIWASLSTLAYALTDLRFISQTTVIWQIGSMVIGLIVVKQLLARRERHIWWLGISIGIVLLTGIHDWLLQSNFIPRWSLYFNHLLPYSAPLLILYIGWFLTGRFVAALNESEELNVSLERRVDAAQKALAASFEELRVLEMKRAAAGERERIYRDLHDDVGAKLLGLAISAQRSNQPREADLARSALQDLRDVVSRSAHSVSRLDNLLADWRAETEQRVLAAGLALDWRIPVEERAQPVSAAAALNISRILREAITNVLRHARASHIAVDLQWHEEMLRLIVLDDGIGLPAAGAKANRGMSNMRARASALGGSITWEAVEPHGSRVVVEIALAQLAQEQNVVPAA